MCVCYYFYYYQDNSIDIIHYKSISPASQLDHQMEI